MSSFLAARSSYAQTGKQARVLGANAHQLVVILFDELLDLLDEIHENLLQDRQANIAFQKSSATAILDALIASLNDGQRNQIATNLHLIYRQCRVLIADNDSNSGLEDLAAARDILKEIASAWSEIG